MGAIKTFTLSTHSRLFSVPDTNKEYLFVEAGKHPYYAEPYRAESYAIVFIKEGGVRLNAGLSSMDVDAPAMITLGPSVIRFFTKRTDLLKMDVVFFKDTFLLEQHVDPLFLTRFDFFENIERPTLPLQEPFLTKYTKIFELFQLTQTTTDFHQTQIIRSYIFALIYEVDAYYRLHAGDEPAVPTAHPLFTKFRQLLRQHYMQHHKLDFYASQLHLAPKSLSAAIKKHTGKSAGKWIDEAVMLEAKVLLQNKTLTVSQVSGMLNFSDQSVFGKFFRANAGMTPVEYRKKLS
ncbi:AraC family transcriptional regulator [Niastella yeongjuensis]|uniref:AraC family transcriptional regulator n=1 Tax=Niastella yeongjuensis TaxID=354355 RepID=A0A1V9EA31_9BACT|nr:AraC family transcriptional regulator [Niastella yeongjuensis]OQP42970.1 AraC family transcriptional regulator [Niastella yeongjuensis]SEO61337.1 AraC-type DNA-binding protein [Niastella yeongjuensis]